MLRHWINVCEMYPNRIAHQRYKPKASDVPTDAEVAAPKLPDDFRGEAIGAEAPEVPASPRSARGRGRGGGRRRGTRGRGRGRAVPAEDTDSGISDVSPLSPSDDESSDRRSSESSKGSLHTPRGDESSDRRSSSD